MKFVSVYLLIGSLSTALACAGSGAPDAPDAGGPHPSDASADDDASGGRTDAGVTVDCGDGALDDGEACDDGNQSDDDGCSATCTAIEVGWVCAEAGIACVPTHVCGDGLLETDEACDDRNQAGGDGCDASCALEAGWSCPVPGILCGAAACGDGILAGFEECDDGTPGGGDGCSASCALESGWTCDAPDSSCRETTCGDGTAEGTEECDDQNSDLGDGCDPLCRREPSCTDGVCEASCGDGVRQASEPCDDGNLRNADGCSSTCVVEAGFTCEDLVDAEPDTLPVAIVYRDFRGHDLVGGHPDFENHNATDRGIVQTAMDGDGKPLYAGNPTTPTTAGAASFDQWYRDTADVNMTYAEELPLARVAADTYVYDNGSFFPMDGRGFVGAGTEPARNNGHNFHFTSELRYWFEYAGGEVLSFRGDDDVWVFINRTLAIDLGGVHSAQNASILLDAGAAQTLDLTVGGIYEVVVLQAERHTTASSYKLTLYGFNSAHSACDDLCGDGVTTPYEVCDDGDNDGGYGSCTADCLGFGPRCGDGEIQPEHEECDDGVNAGGYGGCLPTCQLGPRCGDGVVQQAEYCDDGNDTPTDGCDECRSVID